MVANSYQLQLTIILIQGILPQWRGYFKFK